jgi:hypothetical protein
MKDKATQLLLPAPASVQSCADAVGASKAATIASIRSGPRNLLIVIPEISFRVVVKQLPKKWSGLRGVSNWR